MSASASFTITVLGTGSPNVQIQATFLGPTPVQLSGIASVTHSIRFINPSAVDVTLTEIELTIEGPSAGKLIASILDDQVSLPAGATADSSITIESTAPFLLGDSATIVGTATGA